jgi:hypothetical protein
MPPDVGKAPIGHIYTAIHTFRTPKLLFTSVTHCAIFRSSASGFRHAFSTGAYYSRLTQVSQSLQLLSQPDGVYGANTFTQALPASARGGVISVKLDHHFKIADRVQSMTGRYNFVDEKVLGLEGVYLIKPGRQPAEAAPQPTAPEPGAIGLGYTLYQRAESGEVKRVRASQPFYENDQVRFVIEPNIDGYLYIFYTENDGEPEMIFPDHRLSQGANQVKAHVPY